MAGTGLCQFAASVPAGTACSLGASAQPAGQTCSFSISGSPIDNADVACANNLNWTSGHRGQDWN